MESDSSSDTPTEVAAEVAVVTADLSSSALVSTNPHFITVTGNKFVRIIFCVIASILCHFYYTTWFEWNSIIFVSYFKSSNWCNFDHKTHLQFKIQVKILDFLLQFLINLSIYHYYIEHTFLSSINNFSCWWRCASFYVCAICWNGYIHRAGPIANVSSFW